MFLFVFYIMDYQKEHFICSNLCSISWTTKNSTSYVSIRVLYHGLLKTTLRTFLFVFYIMDY
jgi:hypothetical protein